MEAFQRHHQRHLFRFIDNFSKLIFFFDTLHSTPDAAHLRLSISGAVVAGQWNHFAWFTFLVGARRNVESFWLPKFFTSTMIYSFCSSLPPQPITQRIQMFIHEKSSLSVIRKRKQNCYANNLCTEILQKITSHESFVAIALVSRMNHH